MRIQLTKEAEAKRVRVKQSWDLYQSENWVETLRIARDMGWKEKKVQVRKEGSVYHIEPFEKDCGCPNILRYGDYFE